MWIRVTRSIIVLSLCITQTCLKDTSSLSYHSDYVYSIYNGQFVNKSNSQVESTPTVIYSLCDSIKLNRKKRRIAKVNREWRVWVYDPNYSYWFTLDSHIIIIINSINGNLLSIQNKKDLSQYQHCGVNIWEKSLALG